MNYKISTQKKMMIRNPSVKMERFHSVIFTSRANTYEDDGD
jgi:hypothetical protein